MGAGLPLRSRGFGDMAHFIGKAGALALGLTLVVTTTAAQATPSCWQAREVSAARVRQMQTMLMVATLRCRAAHLDISTDYNAFMTAQGQAVSAANLVIKQHFAQSGMTQVDYDHFATTLANGYGDDETNAGACTDAAALAHEAMAATETGGLDRVAAARLFPAAVPGGACDGPGAPVVAMADPVPAATIALKVAKAEPLPPVLALAAPSPLPVASAPVTLPADVVAALTVMARFHDAQLVAPAAASGPTRMAAAGK